LSEEAAGHVHWAICSVAAVVEEPLLLSEGSVRVLKELFPSDLGRGGNRGARNQELVTIEVRAFAPCLALGGTNRTRGWIPKVPEKTVNQGPSWRNLPRQESLKPRNSSGSLTS
jgi:hypothetical protein